MKKILVTGGTGFIGRQLVPLLVGAGHEVHLTIRNAATIPMEFKNFSLNIHEADILDRSTRQQAVTDARADGLIHLSWFAKPPEFWSATENFKWVDASYELLKEFSEAGGQRALFAGTCAEYEWGHDLCSENETPLKPDTIYGNCKNTLQKQIALDSFGVSTAWARIFFMFGPGDYPNRLIPSLIEALKKGEEFKCQNPAAIRDFVHVADVAQMFLQLLSSSFKGPVNFGSGNPLSIGKLVNKIAEIEGHPELIKFQEGGNSFPPRIVADPCLRKTAFPFVPRSDLNLLVSELLQST